MGIAHIPKKVMAVFERPARHRSRSGEAGGRYLKKNSTAACSGPRGGVYTVEARESPSGSSKPHLCDYIP